VVEPDPAPPQGPPSGGPPINRIAGALAASLVVALLGALIGGGDTNASTTGRAWRAPVGNGWPTQQLASNGVASIDLYWTGAGVLHLQLKNLVRNTAYRMTLFKGPYMAPGTTWSSRGGGCQSSSDGAVVRLPALRTTTKGTIDRSIALSVSDMDAINALPRKIAIAVGFGRLARCGGFQLQQPSGRAGPPAAPTPSAAPSPLESPTCSAWPSEIVDILAVLTTPDGLCLVRYPSAAEAPAFMRGVAGIYFPSPPTVAYVAGATGTEIAVLAHEVCHAHQDRVARDAGQADFEEGWYRTVAGMDYLRSTGWRRVGDRWIERPEAISGSSDPLEDNAVICALWFDPSFGPHYLRRWTPIRFAWAQRWLPLPSFITPWQGTGTGP